MSDLPPLWPPPRRWDPVAGVLELATDWTLAGLPAELALAEGAAGTERVGSAVLDPGLGAEAYRLRIGEAGLDLAAGGTPGLRHGLRSIRQLQRYGPLPRGLLQDEPVLAHRGVMLDISRDRVPTMARLHELVDGIAELKGNHLQLYVEHTFAYAGHRVVWDRASPLSAAELRELDAHCVRRGIVLAGNQNCLGHWERWFRHAPYDALAELDDLAPLLAAPEPGPLSLAPVLPAARRLVCALIDEQLACLSSRIVNIGCDETADIGRGRSAAAVRERGFARVYAEHVAAVVGHCLERGVTPQFWADMALEHPEALALIPAAAVALAWGYEADSDYRRWGRVLAEQGRPWWVCPGTGAWRSLGGRSDARRGSVAAALDGGLAYGAEGLLMTEWGDNGHRQQWPVAWLGLAEGLGAAWCGRAAEDADLPALSLQAFGEPGLAEWLHALGAVDASWRARASHPRRDGRLQNASLPFIDSQLPWAEHGWEPDPAPWAELVVCYEELAFARPPLRNAHRAAACDHAVACCRTLAERARLRRAGGERTALAASLDDLRRQHRALWLEDSRSGGLGDSMARWDRLLLELRHAE